MKNLLLAAAVAAPLTAQAAEITPDICQEGECTTAQAETLTQLHGLLDIDLITAKRKEMLQILAESGDDPNAVEVFEDGDVRRCRKSYSGSMNCLIEKLDRENYLNKVRKALGKEPEYGI